MKKKLPKPIFGSLQETIHRGGKLDPAIANDKGQTALDFARRHEDRKTRKLMER